MAWDIRSRIITCFADVLRPQNGAADTHPQVAWCSAPHNHAYQADIGRQSLRLIRCLANPLQGILMQPCADKTPLDWPDNWGDIDICHLIMENAGYIVFIDKQLDIDWKTTNKLDEEQKEVVSKRNAILNKAADIESIPNDQQELSVRLNFKRMVGEGIARAFDTDWDNANIIIDKAEVYIRERNAELARYWQLSVAITIGSFSLVVGGIIWRFREFIVGAMGDSGLHIILAASMGACGAVLSMVFRMGRLSVSSESGKTLHYIEVVGRCLAGAISSILIALLIKAEFILPILNSSTSGLPIILATGILAGASERWAPSIVSKLEGKLTNQKNEESSDEKKSPDN